MKIIGIIPARGGFLKGVSGKNIKTFWGINRYWHIQS